MSKTEIQQPTSVQKEITAQVLAKIKSFESTGELRIPSDYSPENALKGAMLILEELKDRNKQPVLQVCTKTSIAQSLLKMVVEGLSPLKRQGYFIPYGDELQWSRSYQGSMALAKRVADVKDVPANVIYEGDEFEYGIDPLTGYMHVIKHVQNLKNIDITKIVGAYAIVIYNDGRRDLTVMNMEQIRKAWNQGATKGASPAHQNFTDEMAKKTVINRACKTPINSSTDAFLMEDEYELKNTTVEDVAHEVVTETASTSVVFEIEPSELVKQPKEGKDSAIQPEMNF
jgi:recombination protein RecT